MILLLAPHTRQDDGLQMSEFPGKGAKSGHPVLCSTCKEVAVFKGSKLINNFLRYFYFCAIHGKAALRGCVIDTMDEMSEYKAWKRNKLKEARAVHPSQQQGLRLFSEN